MIQAIPIIIAAIVAISGVALQIYNSDRDPGAVRSMKRHAELAEKLTGVAQTKVLGLLETESNQYSDRMMRRATRKVDGGSVAAMIAVAIVGGGLTYGVTLLALNFWIAWILVVLVGGLTIALMFAGSAQLFKYPEEKNKDPSGSSGLV
ncbi:hypothetical protein [Paeniglutamicibacter sp.]|uniref:hypothetical protein n=1 Tax=Paeniglutamicibacter sp. TaxID=1934391 RepID=UPI003988AFE2